jgi:hypothetical protein
VYRDNVTEGIKSGRGNYWMVPTGSQRFVRVLSLCHLPSNKTCLGGCGKFVQNFSWELRGEESDYETFDVKMSLQEVKA